MKYLITWGCGFIGCNFAIKLAERGDEVTVLDNLCRKWATDNYNYLKANYPQIKIVCADVRIDNRTLQNLVSTVDVVYHLAGQVAVTTSFVDPRGDFEANALGTFNILEAIRLSGNKPIMIYASTNKVYGGMEHIRIEEINNRYMYADLPKWIKEDTLLDFHSPYGCSKGTADQYVRDYSRMYDLRTVVMRQSCIYGTRQFGIEDQGWVAWFTIAAMLDKEITIFGDGKQVRDVLFIDDLFNAWDQSVKHIDVCSGQVFNIGGGINFTMSLLELLAYLEKFLNKKIKYKFGDRRPGDQPVYISDIDKAQDIFWREPKISVEEWVKTLSAWVANNKDMFHHF